MEDSPQKNKTVDKLLTLSRMDLSLPKEDPKGI